MTQLDLNRQPWILVLGHYRQLCYFTILYKFVFFKVLFTMKHMFVCLPVVQVMFVCLPVVQVM